MLKSDSVALSLFKFILSARLSASLCESIRSLAIF